jgi:hypothetical protein
MAHTLVVWYNRSLHPTLDSTASTGVSLLLKVRNNKTMQQYLQRPAPDARAFEEQHCSEVQVSALESDSRTCFICVVRYGVPSSEGEGSPEKPIQINFGNCHHIFGHHCLRQLIDGQESWSNKCPLCRTPWFRTSGEIEAEGLAEILFLLREPQGRRRLDPEISNDEVMQQSRDQRLLTRIGNTLPGMRARREDGLRDRTTLEGQAELEPRIQRDRLMRRLGLLEVVLFITADLDRD